MNDTFSEARQDLSTQQSYEYEREQEDIKKLGDEEEEVDS